jgi:hypothetical protein
MQEPSSGKSGFEILLEMLGPDSAAALEEYERLRSRLRKLFEINRCPDSDGMVDRVFERVETKFQIDFDRMDELIKSLYKVVVPEAKTEIPSDLFPNLTRPTRQPRPYRRVQTPA